MKFFGRKKEKKEEKKTTHVSLRDSTPASSADAVLRTQKKERRKDLLPSNMLRRPRITEKATDAATRGVYVFDIEVRAGKTEISDAIRSLYNVTPVKVHIVSIPKKTVMSRKQRTRGVKGGGKKAYVYLKKGDIIEFV